ncbi:FG-GAP-like repeat-containing protein, partial [Microcoleus sp. herbarium5]|uniref:FG-GAP-like repeat-containing protein n=1 Tax=Microcoleus sp. herbarium5 TaxID=3055434 RepID=UPI002FCFB728
TTPEPILGSPGIVISPASGLVTTEAGGTDTFTIKLNRPPTADVKIDLRSSNEAEGVISTDSITFNSVNWNQWQPITITGVDDRVFDFDKSYQIVTAPAVSADSNYNGLNAPDATVVNRGNTIPTSEDRPLSGDSSSDLDSDTAANPGITVSPTNGLITTKTGAKAKFTLALNSKPTGEVLIGLNVSPQNPAEGSLSTPGVTFTPDNWNIPQEVTVKGEGGTFSAAANRPYTILTAPASSDDSKYSGLDASDVSLTNMFVYDDYPYNQYPQIVVGPTSELTTTEAGDTANFSVVLTQQPMADVVIPVSSDNTAEGTVSVSTLKFTPDNWDTAQTVTIKGINDNQSDGDRPYKIILDPAISSDFADSGGFFPNFVYSGLDPQDVSVTNLERSYTFNKINTEISNYFNGGAISDWGDYSGDGKLDFIAAGGFQLLSNPGSNLSFTGTSLYRNTGSTFTADSGYSLELADAASWGDYDNDGQLNFALQINALLSQKYPSPQPPNLLKIYGPTALNSEQTSPTGSSQSWADYNNDGKLDLLNATQQSITNENADGTFSTLENASLLYRNTGKSDIVLTVDITTQLPGVLNGSAAWGDYNKDGKPDILLTGDSVSGKIAKVFGNTGSGFSEDTTAALPGVSNGSAAWGDYDNDGDLDILLAGNSDSGNITKVYRNTGSGFSEDTTAALPGGSSAAWGDYDNDGKFDILLDSKVYRNTGSGFSEDTSAGVIGDGQGSWGDYDSDGKLDILLGNQVYRSNTANANTRPTAPTGLSAEPSGLEVTFNWNKATDAQTPADGLSYNLRVGTTPGGKDILAPMSLEDGTRQIVGLGNVSQNTQWQLKDLSPGTYYWSVQAIDAAWAGSPFATEGSFTVANNPPVLNYGPDTTPWHYQYIQSSNSSTFEYTFPENTFTDPDPGDQLTYTATLMDGSPLPSWLTFNPDTRTLSGTSPKLQQLTIKLTATDRAGLSVSDNDLTRPFQGMLLTFGPNGVVIDGYISGATLFLDANKNGILDTNEPSTTTDSGGKFNLNIPFETFDTNKNGEIDPSEGNLVAIGGIDTATGLPLETPVTAPPDASVVTLLTTLIADLIDKGIEPEEAQSF